MSALKHKNKGLSLLADGILSGLMIGIGGMVSLSCENRYIGAFLFSLGLFCIVQLKYGLYTGKVGYVVQREPFFLGEVFFTLLANGIGTFLAALLLRMTRFAALSEKAGTAMAAKLEDTPVSMLVLAFFCGILMFSAVEIHRRCTESGNHMGALFGIVLPVMVFILCGFNHCIADLFFYFFAGCPSPERTPVYFPVVILGNAAGGMLIPLLKKCSDQSPS